ncbi:SseB family protein [Micromonospora sp. NPDC051925]|uniref:SseB family protein n=1 Tax=Micromonospora sp. NPDC051925 TaxID=3364288 RepID=UPI0037CB8EC4
MTDWEPATEAEAAMRDALRASDQELYFRILAGSDLFLPVSGQALAGAASTGWGTWTTGGRTHVLAFTSAAAMHTCLGASAGPFRRSRYAELAVEWPNHEWWLAVNPGLPIEGYLPAWFVSQLSRGDVRLPGRTTGVRSRPEREQTPGRTWADGTSDVEPTADLSAGPTAWTPSRPVPPSTAVPPAGGVTRPSGGTSLTDERGRPVAPPGGGPLDATTGPSDDGRSGGTGSPDLAAASGQANAGWPTVPRRRLLGEESTGPANGRSSFFEPSTTRGASRSPRDNPLRSSERANPAARPGLGGQPFPRRRQAPTQPVEDEATRAFRVGGPTDQPIRPVPGNGTATADRRPDPLAEEPTRAFRMDPLAEEPTRAFRTDPSADEATRAFRVDPLAEEPTRAFRVGPSAAEATQALPRRQRTPDGSSDARQTRPSTGSFAGAAGSPGAVLGEAEELSPSVAEPVSGPPTSRRGFTPIVIEGVILESRDLPVVPAPAPTPPVVPAPAPAPPVVPVPTASGPDGEDTVNLNGKVGPFGPPARPAASGPGFPTPATEVSVPSRPAPDDLWTPAAERTASAARPDVSAVSSAAPATPSTAGPGAAPTALGAPAAGPGAATAPSGAAATDSAVLPAADGRAADGPRADGSPAVVSAAAGPTRTAVVAPGSGTGGQAAPAAAGPPSSIAAPVPPVVRAADLISDPDDLWRPAAERVASVSPAGSGPAAAPPSGAGATSSPEAVPPVVAPEDPAAATVDELFQPANEVEENLLDAAGTGSTDGFLSTLLLARVLLPVNPDSVSGSRPGEPGFEWRTGTTDGETYVVVYTSPERLAEHDVLSVETIEVRFVQLIRCWPDPSWAFTVNPGTPVGAKLPGEQIVALASWAAEVGLGDEADLEPVAAAEAPAERTRYAPPVTDPSRPVVMQKAIAPSQLAYYLERGYDRVSGFVHRAGELAHLTTPAELYDALGLGYPDSPFARDAEATYVLRWPAYRPSLYRIPYGGQNEAAMRAMEGWVIERAPFRGNGFAPGESSDVVAEFKVDSARLPHGAQLWRIGAEGTERVIAILDTDALVWRRVGEP